MLYGIIDDVSDDKKENYAEAIDGYCKWWGKKKIVWVTPPRKTWAIGDIRIELNPELGLVYNGKIHYIKLFVTTNDILDKKHADLILTLMEKELREKVPEEAVFCVLDIKRGKLHEYKKGNNNLYSLLKGEAVSFETMWKDL